MNHTDEKLAQVLRELAGAAPTEAPPELETSLRGRFRRHHRRRRLRAVAVLGVAAGMMLAASLTLWRRVAAPSVVVQAPSPATPTVREAAPAMAAPAISQGSRSHPLWRDEAERQVETSAGADVRKTAHHRNLVTAKQAQRRPALPAAAGMSAATSDFVPLPAYDPAFPAGRSLVIRLEMPGTALRLVGYPVAESLSERRVVTDVLVSEDGTPYAVRLINARTTR